MLDLCSLVEGVDTSVGAGDDSEISVTVSPDILFGAVAAVRALGMETEAYSYWKAQEVYTFYKASISAFLDKSALSIEPHTQENLRQELASVLWELTNVRWETEVPALLVVKATASAHVVYDSLEWNTWFLRPLLSRASATRLHRSLPPTPFWMPFDTTNIGRRMSSWTKQLQPICDESDATHYLRMMLSILKKSLSPIGRRGKRGRRITSTTSRRKSDRYGLLYQWLFQCEIGVDFALVFLIF